MKRNFYPLLSFVFLLASICGITSANAQGGVYFREGFGEGTGWPSAAADAIPFKEVVTTTSGSWYTFGSYRSGGPTGNCGENNSHIRFGNLNNVGLGVADSAFLITPLASAGIFDLTYYNGRVNRRFTIYKTSETDATTTNWVQVVHFPTTGYNACDQFTVEVNDASARRLKIVARSATDSDLDSFVMRSVGALPTRFGSFYVQQKNDEVVANWDAYNESQLRGYYLQKSTDGSSFADVNFVTAKNRQAADYTTTDKIKGGGNLYYRVKSVDLDGKTGYGPVARLSVNSQGFDGVVVKNPVRGNTLEVQLNGLQPGTYQVSLNGISGSKLATKAVQVQSSSVTVSMELPASVGKGIQILTVTGGSFRHAGKVLVE